MSSSFETKPEIPSLDIRQYALLFWQWGWLILLVALLAGTAAYLISLRIAPVYQATTRLLVSAPPTTVNIGSSEMVTGASMSTTYSQMLTDTPVLQGVIDKLKLPMTPTALEKKITVDLIINTQLINVSVIDTNPARAANIANTLSSVFADRIQALQATRFAATQASVQQQITDVEQQIQVTNTAISQQTDPAQRDQLEAKLAQYRQIDASLVTSYEQVQLAEAQTTTNIVQVQPAATPNLPISPKKTQNSLLAAVAGLLLACGAIFTIDALDDTVNSPEELTKRFGLPVLGIIARHEITAGAPITLSQPRSPISEAFRSLRTNVHYASVDRPLHTIMVTSPTAQDGKSTIAANLALVLAQGGQQIALVDADLRRPTIHRQLGLDNQNGLDALFVKPVGNLDGTLQKSRQDGLRVITAGNPPPNPSELLGSKKMRAILDQLLGEVDLAIIDTPPSMAVTDAVVLSQYMDGVLLVVRPGVTKLDALKQAVEQFRRAGTPLLGLVINQVKLKHSRYSYYYKSYYNQDYYRDADGDKKPAQ